MVAGFGNGLAHLGPTCGESEMGQDRFRSGDKWTHEGDTMKPSDACWRTRKFRCPGVFWRPESAIGQDGTQIRDGIPNQFLRGQNPPGVPVGQFIT